MDFFNQTGKLAIGSRLRMLTDKITVDAAAIYKMFGVDLKPKWFPVFFCIITWGGKNHYVHSQRDWSFSSFRE